MCPAVAAAARDARTCGEKGTYAKLAADERVSKTRIKQLLEFAREKERTRGRR